LIITYSIISSNIYIVKGKGEITAHFRRNLRAKISEPADLPRRFVSYPRQSRGWALCFATAFSYGRSKASEGSALKGASSEVRRIGDKVSLNEAETLPRWHRERRTAVNALQRMCQVRECAVELRIQLAKPGSEIGGGRKAWCGIRVLGNGHNASIVRCLSSESAIHGRG